MKKVISLIISLTILLSAFSFNTFATEELLSAISSAYDSNDNIYYNISAWYKFDKDKSGNSVVIEMVKKSKGFSDETSDDDIIYIDEVIIDDNGEARFEFKVKAEDKEEYIIRFTSGDFEVPSSLTKNITLVGKTGLKNIVDDILETVDLNEMVEKINSSASQLNLNVTYLNELDDPTVVASVLKGNTDITVKNYSEIFDRTVIFTYLKHQTDLLKTINMLEYYDSTYLKIKDQQYLGFILHIRV